jgi:hypothetical protein
MKLAVDWPMTSEQLETLVAAVAVKCDLPMSVPALIRGLPERHPVQMSLHEAADYVLTRWQSARTETDILTHDLAGGRAGIADRLRDDAP